MTPEERTRIIEEYLPWIEQVAKSRFLPANMTVDDLINAGVRGFCEALDKFSSGYDILLKTFASKRVDGAMTDLVRSWMHSTRHYQPDMISMGDIEYDEPGEDLESVDKKIDIERFLGLLPEIEHKYITLKFFDSCTRKEIAYHLGCTVRQADVIGDKAMARLKKVLTESGITKAGQLF